MARERSQKLRFLLSLFRLGDLQGMSATLKLAVYAANLFSVQFSSATLKGAIPAEKTTTKPAALLNEKTTTNGTALPKQGAFSTTVDPYIAWLFATGSNAVAASGPAAASFPLAAAGGNAPLPSSGGGCGSASSRKRRACVIKGSGISKALATKGV